MVDDIDETRRAETQRRRQLREAKRRTARRRGHLRLVIAILLLAGVMIAVCWVAGSVRSLLSRRPASQAAENRSTDVAQDASSSSPGLTSLSPLASALARPSMGVLQHLPSAPINRRFAGVTMFRGNSTRTYYGEGPVPKDPKILWSFPSDGTMASTSTVGDETKRWAGTGWTGQPVVAERGGRTEVIFGAFDRKIHFLDGKTGERVRPDFATGDIIKGSVTLDPDGYPLLYSGSRDNYFRVIALDRDEPTELWKLSAYATKNGVWNNDWDGNGVVVNDHLFIGGENSHFFIVKLNRGYGKDRKARVDPKVVFDFPAFDDELFAALGDKEVSIENSPALLGDRVYFSNSGGLVWGIRIRGLTRGKRPRPFFRFWTGDDTDASVVVDDDGMLYVGSELQRHLPRAKQVGQIMKLNPNKPKDPLVWSVKVPPAGNDDGLGGVWATPALHKDMLYEPTHPGGLLGIDRRTGKVVFKKSFAWHAWGSAIVVDDVLMVPDTYGTVHAYDVRNPKVDPPRLWKVSIPTGTAIESTPVCWKGRIYVGARDGKFYCFGDK